MTSRPDTTLLLGAIFTRRLDEFFAVDDQSPEIGETFRLALGRHDDDQQRGWNRQDRDEAAALAVETREPPNMRVPISSGRTEMMTVRNSPA